MESFHKMIDLYFKGNFFSWNLSKMLEAFHKYSIWNINTLPLTLHFTPVRDREKNLILEESAKFLKTSTWFFFSTYLGLFKVLLALLGEILNTSISFIWTSDSVLKALWQCSESRNAPILITFVTMMLL